MIRHRIAIAALSFSAAGLVAWTTNEGWEPIARQPVPGDPCTNGFGNTHGVKCGDRVDPVTALQVAQRNVSVRFEPAIKRCLNPGVMLTQSEYDVYVDFTGNVGPGNFCGSTMAGLVNAGLYADACRQFPRWKYVQNKDCTVPANKCGGIPKRRDAAMRCCLNDDCADFYRITK